MCVTFEPSGAVVLNIATWAQEYYRKPLLFNTVCCCIKKCNLNICYSRRNLLHQFYSLDQSSSQIIKKTVERCAVLLILSSQSQRPKGQSRLSLATEAKANVCHGMEVQQSKQHGWLGYVRRYHWNRSIETYTAIKRMSFMGSPLLLYQDNASLNLMCYCTTAGFRRPSECPRLASRSVSYWKRMAHHEKTKTITDCWATEVLYQARLDKNVACRI